MERLDVTFTGHYFAALDGYFHPGRYPKPPRSWVATFDAASRPEPINLQHMLVGINAHIDLDLGIAAQSVALNEAVKNLGDSAWRFARLLAFEPGFARPATIWARDRSRRT
jgi:hypothetical protein